MPNKYHEALNVAIQAIRKDAQQYPASSTITAYREKTIDELRDLQNLLSRIARNKQLLQELDLEESK